jgi:hypothetical protein
MLQDKIVAIKVLCSNTFRISEAEAKDSQEGEGL